MAIDDKALEAEIRSKGLTAPRITPEDIDAQIVAEYSARASDVFSSSAPLDEALWCLTICVLVLKNGFTVVGTSACASPKNYDRDIGHRLAREDARDQIWRLEGYRLRSRLAEGVSGARRA